MAPAMAPERRRRRLPLALALAAWPARAAVDWGDGKCPCATREDLGNLSDSVAVGYGIGCGSHELRLLASGVTTNLPPKAAECRATNSSWCYSSWCFVRTDTCKLLYSFMESAPSLLYSYATCGYLDTFTPWMASNQLENNTLTVALLSNSGGYTGNYCYAGAKDCVGPTATFWKSLLENSKVALQNDYRFTSLNWPNASIPFPAGAMRQFRAQTPAAVSNSTFDACVYMTGMGYIDICIGQATINTARVQVSNMVEYMQVDVWLVSRSKVAEPDSFGHRLAAAFEPFDSSGWLAIVIVVTIGGIITGLHEQRSMPHGLCPRGRAAQLQLSESMGYLAYDGWMGCLTGGRGFYEFRTLGARLTGVGLAVFALMVVAAYTANLASGLVLHSITGTEVSSMDDVIKGGHLICVEQVMSSLLMTKTSVPLSQIVLVKSRADLLKKVVNGSCAVAAQRDEDFEWERKTPGSMACEFKQVQLLFSVAQGVMVSSRVFRGVQSQTRRFLEAGGWELAVKGYAVLDVCPALPDLTSTQLGADAMTGPIAVACILALAGITVTLGEMVLDRLSLGQSGQVMPMTQAYAQKTNTKEPMPTQLRPNPALEQRERRVSNIDQDVGWRATPEVVGWHVEVQELREHMEAQSAKMSHQLQCLVEGVQEIRDRAARGPPVQVHVPGTLV